MQLLFALALELWAKVVTTGATASTPSATEAAAKVLIVPFASVTVSA